MEFLHQEAEYLDERSFREWLMMLAEDVRYEVPIRITRAMGTREQDFANTGYHMKDNFKTLSMRVERLYSEHAYAEDPPSRTTRLITNVRVRPLTASPEEYSVKSNFACYRAQGEGTDFDLLMGERRDVLRSTGGELKLASRCVLLVHTTLPTANLGLFL
ncbi:MAG: aromatic-ring-hydroxylating dioxygenase subunit beta [Rhodospirillaceae bacterium]|nr:aromatic-ring-hydroxylating dioxygenase subunit beta [Rhodospirillaceae bacterium]